MAEQCPAGFTILVVDCDSTCLAIVSRMLKRFGYKVVTAKQASDALCILREREDELDLILAEVCLPDVDKYELLDTFGETSSLPVVILSGDDNENSMLGCFYKGAAYYLVKPITMNDIKYLWQFSYMKREEITVTSEEMDSFQVESPQESASSEVLDCQPLMNTGEQDAHKGKRKNLEAMDGDNEEDSDGLTVTKKPKLVWTDELHNKFLAAVRVLGIDNAHPKKILEHMKVPGLRKENISSHLQKYRLSLKREQDEVQNAMLREYHFSSMYNLQKGPFHFPEPRFLMTPLQPQFRSNFQNNFNGSISVPSLGSAYLPIHLVPNNNSLPISKYGELAPYSIQLHSMCSSSSHIGTRTSNRMPSRCSQMESHGFQEFPRQTLSFSSLENSGFESATHGATIWGSTLQQQQQQEEVVPSELLPLPPPPGQDQGNDIFEGVDMDDLLGVTNCEDGQNDLWQINYFPRQDQQEHDMLEAQGVDTDDLFGMAKGYCQVNHDEDLNDLWEINDLASSFSSNNEHEG